MSFDSVERSDEGRRPVEFYTFFRDFQAYRYTSADRNITINGAEFLARPLSRSRIRAGAELARGALKITAPRDLPVADLYRIAPPSTPVTFTLQQYHDGDGDMATLWTGRIATVAFEGLVANITLEPVFVALRRVGLRRLYQRQCPHVLYGAACGVSASTARVEGFADAVSGVSITSAQAAQRANGFFAGGFVEYFVDLGITERRFITDHVGGVLTVSNIPVGLSAGAAIRIYPGCDHTLATCSGKFNNAANYGGFPYMTTKNPFTFNPSY